MVTQAPRFNRPAIGGKGTTPQRITALPERPHAVKEGALARLCGELQYRSERAGAQGEVVRRLEAELAGHRDRIDTAQPGPDDAHYLKISASLAAVPILERTIAGERAELTRLIESRESQQQHLNLAWREYELLKQYALSGGPVPEEHQVKVEGAALLQRLEEMVGAQITWSD